ncbi:Methyltransferase type 12 [Alkaliphilus metalliredigens QYMF]|uniref:Methyltransferase type 12 n=1 Tax=Alkaliphilus metalliredigens (strain QYMF) TaxID=293826 RepID=A6TN46_ALKMQ|nr:class I SAM-dependent methyltransferase [Alkaliphilus metalliredigens]ABR47614.1 Methyltransferase type 12 [Alkaliphilus metalliredigens QYMF]
MNFDIEAVNWDSEKRIKRAEIIADEIIKSIEIKEQYIAMEFGCGTGLISFNLYDEFKHVVLVDTSKGMVDILNEKIQEAKIKNMTPLQREINDEVVFTNKFDVIYTSMALHHVVDVETTLKSLYKFMNNNGYLCIVELTEDDGSFHKLEENFNGHNGFNQNELKKMLGKIGFKDVKTNIFYNDNKIIGDLKINYSLFIMVARK